MIVPSRRRLTATVAMAFVALTAPLSVAACSAGTDEASSSDDAATSPAETQDPDPDVGDNDGADSGGVEESEAGEPVPYVPAGQPGTAEAYNELIARLDAEVPEALRAEVPWPDLRDPDPVDAQQAIFDMWLWMAANYPEPALVEVLTAPGSPSRADVVGIFGFIDASNQLETRKDPPYQAFDHLVVTFESAGLPLWLARDVPEDAVVVYYSDRSGPTEVRDRDTLELTDVRPAVPTRTWLSIMVPTDAGWRLWRDELIEPNDAELEVPDIAPPGNDPERPVPEV